MKTLAIIQNAIEELRLYGKTSIEVPGIDGITIMEIPFGDFEIVFDDGDIVLDSINEVADWLWDYLW